MTDEAIDIIQSFTDLIAAGIGVQLKVQIRNMFIAEDKYGNTSMMEFLLRQQRGKEEIWSGEYLR